jgi:hypothetical protein
MSSGQRWLDNSKGMPFHELGRKRIESLPAPSLKKRYTRVQVLDQEKVWKIFKRCMIISGKSMNE